MTIAALMRHGLPERAARRLNRAGVTIPPAGFYVRHCGSSYLFDTFDDLAAFLSRTPGPVHVYPIKENL